MAFGDKNSTSPEDEETICDCCQRRQGASDIVSKNARVNREGEAMPFLLKKAYHHENYSFVSLAMKKSSEPFIRIAFRSIGF